MVVVVTAATGAVADSRHHRQTYAPLPLLTLLLRMFQPCQFIDCEAEVSEADEASSDDDDDSDLNSLDGSFIDDATLLTQAANTEGYHCIDLY